VVLNKTFISTVKRTKLPYLNKKWIVPGKCPYCNRGLEVVIDETHNGRNINLRLPQ
jgi:hypothetical protein